ncbi:hypothetical protein COT97_00345 [Candidatus Falkowbacteria bacterium CG10_big_fil_rev_8_21_14_0_10_39_11]|uniref:Uncharacterized protein n=1 Tax=Candidatus Falkowbacteria bacterium CG10_big_fil_rev_8_21_14_0_10_39_11 TaxID=1974565 RepID=A0A2H0V641_9BACT|nr:MAG: hypothetical protein COT97_00345 [Candidatus Falkowbacteria bacterium CG10_big_fil_rev_8_21_14_0_10_39_11]
MNKFCYRWGFVSLQTSKPLTNRLVKVLVHFGQKILFDPDRHSGEPGYVEISLSKNDPWNDVAGVITTEGRHVNLGGLSGLHLLAELESDEGDFKVSFMLSGREEMINPRSSMSH